MATRYYVGDQAPSPLVVRMRRTDGSVFDLTSYDSVLIEGDGLPPGLTTVIDAEGGVVQRDFDLGFAEAGVILIRARLEEAGLVDYTDIAELPVWDPSEPTTSVVTPGQVEGVTGTAVSTQDIARAQGLVTLAVGVNLSDPVAWVLLSPQDQFWIGTAISYGSACIADTQGQDTVVVVKPPGVASMSTGDQSVSFDATPSGSAGGGSGLAELCPEAVAALRRVSWLGTHTVHARPFLSGRGAAPDPWVRL